MANYYIALCQIVHRFSFISWSYVCNQGALYKWTEHSLKCHSGEAPTTPRGWMGVEHNSKYSHQDLYNEGSKFFLKFIRTCFLSCLNMGILWWISDGVELRKSISMSSLNFLQGYEFDHALSFHIMLRKYFHSFFQKNIGSQ